MPSSYRSNDSQANKDWIWKHVSIWLQIVLLFTVWWDDPEFPWLLLKLEKKRMRAALMLPLVYSRKETLTHYWHLCVWGVKCYITQRSEKSKRLEAEMEKAGEAVFLFLGSFLLQKWNWKRWGKSHCSLSRWWRAALREFFQENLRGTHQSRAGVSMAVCVKDKWQW